jgi:hypothetical protein
MEAPRSSLPKLTWSPGASYAHTLLVLLAIVGISVLRTLVCSDRCNRLSASF